MALTRRSWTFFVLAIVDICVFSAWVLIRDTTFHGTGNPVHIPRSPDTLWFAPEGDLYASFSKGLHLNVVRYAEDEKAKPWECDLAFGLLIPGSLSIPRGIGKEDLTWVLAESLARNDLRPVADSTLQYAISSDARQIAWVWEGRLWLAPLAEVCSNKVDKRKLTQVVVEPKDLAGLQLQGDSANPYIVRIFEDGEIFVQKLGGVATLLTLAPASRPSDLRRWMLPRKPGDFITLTAPDSDRVAIILTEPKPNLKPLELGISNPTAIHRLSESDLLVGTASGVLVHLKGIDREPKPKFYTVPAIQAIRAIASYSKDDVIVGGDFRSLIWVRKNHTLRTLSATPRFVTGLAVSQRRIAYSYQGGMSYAPLTCSPRVSEAGKYKLTLMFSFLGVLAFLRAILADRR